MICPHCGQYNDDGAHFCGNCGTDLSAAQTQPQPVVEQPSYTPDYASQPTYADASYAQPQQQPSPFDTGVQPAQQPFEYAQPQQGYEQQTQYAQQDYAQAQYAQPQQTYQQPPAPTADPYAQQQYAQGYNQPVQQPQKKSRVLPIVLGVVAVVAVVGSFLLFRGSGSGSSSSGGTSSGGGGTPTIAAPSDWDLSDTYTDSTYGYSYRMPDGGTMKTLESGTIRFQWTDPGYLVVDTYVNEGYGHSIDEQLEYVVDEFDGEVVDQGSSYGVTRCTDPNDGDTNYTLYYLSGNDMYFMDIYYKPADESVMHDVAFEIMNSFSV